MSVYVTATIVLGWGLLLGAGVVLLRARMSSAEPRPDQQGAVDPSIPSRGWLPIALVILPLAALVCEWAAGGVVTQERLLVGAALLVGIVFASGWSIRR